MKTKLKCMLLTLLLAFASFGAYSAIAEDSSGTANLGNSAPVINSVTFTQDGTAIDVDTTYTVTVSVTDDNELNDLDDIEFIIWDSLTTTEGGADSNDDHYTFEYDEDLDTWEEIGPDTGDSHLVLGSCSDPADHSATTGDFTLGFKLHKTANKEATTTAWKIKIIVTDAGTASDNDQTKTFGVTFYSELTVNDNTHSWTVSAGENDQQIDSPVDGDIDITVTANANFDVQAKGDGALTSGGDTIPLVNVEVHKDTLGSAVGLTTGYVDILGLTGLTAGEDQAHSFILWLSVPGGQATGAYTYILSVQIVEA